MIILISYLLEHFRQIITFLGIIYNLIMLLLETLKSLFIVIQN
jgi:hypothetical protein